MKTKEGYMVMSKSGKHMGTYPTPAQAEKRLKEVEFYKGMKKGAGSKWD